MLPLSKVAYVSLVLERKLCHPWHSVDSMACQVYTWHYVCSTHVYLHANCHAHCFVLYHWYTHHWDRHSQSVSQSVDGWLHHVFP